MDPELKNILDQDEEKAKVKIIIKKEEVLFRIKFIPDC
jgi:hypothetical protein